MASFPPRKRTLERVITAILPQLDELVLYLNRFESAPGFCEDRRIRVILGCEAAGDLRDNGKFFDLPRSDDSYVFTFDDDISYPGDYVSKMIHYIEIFGRSSVVGVHGVIFPERNFSMLEEREVFAFRTRQQGRFVDLLGTGTTAWHSSTLKPCLSDFRSKGVCDLWFARLAAERSVPLFSVPRRSGWLEKLGDYSETLYRETVDAPEIYFDVYRQNVEPVLKQMKVRSTAEHALLRQLGPEGIRRARVDLAGPLQQLR